MACPFSANLNYFCYQDQISNVDVFVATQRWGSALLTPVTVDPCNFAENGHAMFFQTHFDINGIWNRYD